VAYLTQAVVKVGDGRGFVVEHRGRVVITTSHCLPTDADGRVKLPPSHPMSYLHERTYPKLLGPLGGEPTVWAECFFVDPIADIAVLGSPDNQALSEEAEAYEKLVEGAAPLTIVDAPKMGRERIPGRIVSGHRIRPFMDDSPGCGPARVLSLTGQWLKCTVARRGRWLTVEDEGLIVSGMSGSPVLSVDGKAIGLISTNGYCPVLMHCLPAWFFK
jgi:hypothetical protein